MAEKGLSFLLKLAGTAVGGMRTTAMTINGEEVDVTTKDSTSQWRELLAGAGVVSMTITAAGVFIDNNNVITIRSYAIARTLNSFVLAFESGDTYTGNFQVTNFEHAGDYNGEVTYSMTLESSGVATFAAA